MLTSRFTSAFKVESGMQNDPSEREICLQQITPHNKRPHLLLFSCPIFIVFICKTPCERLPESSGSNFTQLIATLYSCIYLRSIRLHKSFITTKTLRWAYLRFPFILKYTSDFSFYIINVGMYLISQAKNSLKRIGSAQGILKQYSF